MRTSISKRRIEKRTDDCSDHRPGDMLAGTFVACYYMATVAQLSTKPIFNIIDHALEITSIPRLNTLNQGELL
jgi:hypothetical protein